MRAHHVRARIIRTRGGGFARSTRGEQPRPARALPITSRHGRSPFSAAAIATLGRLTDLSGDEAQDIRLLESAIELEPRYARAYVQLGKLHLSHGRSAEALSLLERAAELAPDATSGIGALAIAYARAGRTAEAAAVCRRLGARAAVGHVPALTRAEVAFALGQVDSAFRWLERAADDREPLVVFLAVDPLYEPLRADPRLAALVRRLGLEPRRSSAGVLRRPRGYAGGGRRVSVDPP